MDCHIWHPSVVNFASLNSFRSTHTDQYADTATYISHLYFLDLFLLESIKTEREKTFRMGHKKSSTTNRTKSQQIVWPHCLFAR